MESKKNILIFSLAYHPFVGGAEVALKEITDRLGGDFSFAMITANLDGQQKDFERLGNIDVYRVSLFPPPYEGGGWGEVKKLLGKYLFPWLAYKKALELHGQNNYQLIWAMMANQAGWAALKFKKKFHSVKYLLTLQEGDSEWDIWLRTWLIRPIYKAIYRRADYIQAISNFLAARAKKLGAKCTVDIVPNGVNTVIARSHVDGATKQSHFRKIVTVSRLVKKNGIKYLIQSMKNVNGELIILGDGQLKTKLKKLTQNLNLENKIKFLGQIPNEQVYNELSQADVFVRPSLSEGLGNVFLEAMSVGVPVIGTKVGGIPDFLRDGQTGWFCEVKNPRSIAEKINYILDEKNQAEVQRVVESARQMVAEKYNWDGIVQKIKNIFESLMIMV